MKDTSNLADPCEVSTPEPFRYETKYLVLKFLGLSQSGSSFGSSGSGSHNDSDDLSPNSSILVNYQSSRSISHTSEDNWSWKSGSHSSSASIGKLNLSLGSAGLKDLKDFRSVSQPQSYSDRGEFPGVTALKDTKEFRSSSQPQSYSDRGEFPLRVKKASKSTQLTPNSCFSSESSLNVSGPAVKGVTENDHSCGSPSQLVLRQKKHKIIKPKPLTLGDRFGVPGDPDLESPILGDCQLRPQSVDNLNLVSQSGADSPAITSQADGPSTKRDSVKTLEGTPEDRSEWEGRHSRQDVFTSDSYESVDTLLGEEYQNVEADSADVFDDQDSEAQTGSGLNWELGNVPGEESDKSERAEDMTDGPGLQAVGGQESQKPAYMDLLPGPIQPPDSLKGRYESGAFNQSIKHGAGDRSGLNLEGLAMLQPNTLTVEETPMRRRYSFNTMVNYLQDDVSEALADLQVELNEASHSQHIPLTSESPFSPQSPCTNVAHVLGVIGDQVNQEYAHILEQASNHVLPRQELVGYDDFREAAQQIVETTSQTLEPSVRHWYQAGLLLCFSKRVAMGMIQGGERGLGRLAEYTTRAIEDTLANYIINAGGWNSVGELNLMTSSPLNSSLSLSTHTPSPSSESNPFFTRQLSAKSDPDCNKEAEPDAQVVQGDEVGCDEVDCDTPVDNAEIVAERSRSNTAIFQGAAMSDDDGSQGDRFEILNVREGDAADVEEDVNNDTAADAEQSRVNRYLGYVQAGMTMVALSASVAISIVNRQ
ncbi:uncharacterized protein LOC135488146 [Lineus longissimus]|uniref:uncharacterized protein LOC135488146 n=1 Tax=Lineus longissimus TaxID=88925 RepID=UPI002B4F654D